MRQAGALTAGEPRGRLADALAVVAHLGFGAGTANLAEPPVHWQGTDTWIQRTGVNQNFGAYDDPDSYYAEHGDNLSGLRAWVYGVWIRHVLNRNVASIRGKARRSAAP